MLYTISILLLVLAGLAGFSGGVLAFMQHPRFDDWGVGLFWLAGAAFVLSAFVYAGVS